jgi:hypothetical protein
MVKPRSLSTVFLYFGFSSLPLWFASRLLGLSIEGVFGIEFVAIGIFSMFIRRTWIVIGLLLATVLGDLLYCVEKTYLFSASDMMASASSAPLYARSHGWSFAAIGVRSRVCV